MTDQRIAAISARCEAARCAMARLGSDFSAPGVSVSLYNALPDTIFPELRAIASNANMYIPYLLSQIAGRDAEIERLREAQRWIPISERLPQTYRHENGEPIEFMVCLWGAKEATALCFNGSQWFEFDWTNGRVAGYYTVTHWMPLPAGPKEGAPNV